jgi:hypothetical protein
MSETSVLKTPLFGWLEEEDPVDTSYVRVCRSVCPPTANQRRAPCGGISAKTTQDDPVELALSWGRDGP